MNRFREKLQRFMIGRYGMDQLGRFLFKVLCVLVVLNLFVRFGVLALAVNVLELAVIVLLYFRMFSKNVNRRWQENQRICGCSFMCPSILRGFASALRKGGNTAFLNVRAVGRRCGFPGDMGR